MCYLQEEDNAGVGHGICKPQDATAHDGIAQVESRHPKGSFPFKLEKTSCVNMVNAPTIIEYCENLKNMMMTMENLKTLTDRKRELNLNKLMLTNINNKKNKQKQFSSLLDKIGWIFQVMCLVC